MTHDLLTAFSDWVQTKPAGEEYDYGQPDVCALGQYGKAVSNKLLQNVGDPKGIVPDEIDDAIIGHPRTFGALAERLAPHTTMAKAIRQAADNGAPCHEIDPILEALTRSAAHDAACLEAVEGLAGIREELNDG